MISFKNEATRRIFNVTTSVALSAAMLTTTVPAVAAASVLQDDLNTNTNLDVVSDVFKKPTTKTEAIKALEEAQKALSKAQVLVDSSKEQKTQNEKDLAEAKKAYAQAKDDYSKAEQLLKAEFGQLEDQVAAQAAEIKQKLEDIQPDFEDAKYFYTKANNSKIGNDEEIERYQQIYDTAMAKAEKIGLDKLDYVIDEALEVVKQTGIVAKFSAEEESDLKAIFYDVQDTLNQAKAETQKKKQALDQAKKAAEALPNEENNNILKKANSEYNKAKTHESECLAIFKDTESKYNEAKAQMEADKKLDQQATLKYTKLYRIRYDMKVAVFEIKELNEERVFILEDLKDAKAAYDEVNKQREDLLDASNKTEEDLEAAKAIAQTYDAHSTAKISYDKYTYLNNKVEQLKSLHDEIGANDSSISEINNKILKTNTELKQAEDSYTEALAQVAVSQDNLDWFEFKVIKGANQTVKDNASCEFTINADADGFLKAVVDGKDVDSTYIEVKSGSTVLTLKQEFIQKLEEGKHLLEILYSNEGSAKTEFSVTKVSVDKPTGNGEVSKPVSDTKDPKHMKSEKTSSATPSTGDISMMYPATMALLGLAAVGGSKIKKAKHFK